MKHYKNTENKVFAFYKGDTIPDGLVEISDAEKDELLKPSAEQLKDIRMAEINARLAEIDREAIRPLRSVQAGNAAEFDLDKLAALENEAETLRKELQDMK